MTTAADQPDSFVLYDGDCPICRSYMALAQLRTLRPDIAVLNARDHPGLVAALRARGHEINDSILVKLGPRVYEGAGATGLIARLGSDNPWTRRAALYAIGGGPWAATLYPWLRATRNLLLRLLGKPLIS
jgi:predicted DCC family thiol-disulfide oxidoreductase YuxK